MTIFHLYRERFKSRRLFFSYGPEDVNKSNSLLPVKRWTDPCTYPPRTVPWNFYTIVTSSEFSFTTLVGSHHWTAQVWVPCWPKPDRNQDVVLLRCKAETRESLWRGQLGDTHTWIRTLCRSAKCNYPDLKPFTYVGWFWCGSCSHSKYHQSVHSEGKLSLVLDVTGTRSNLLLYSVEMDILVSPQGSVFFSFFSLEKYCMQIILEILSVLFISFFPLTWVRIQFRYM